MNNGEIQKRKSTRLKGYDYSLPGAYFITMCSFNNECLFGEIVDGEMVLNDYGKILHEEWIKSSEIRNEIELDEFSIMPNHMHGIVIIKNSSIDQPDRGDRPVAPTDMITDTGLVDVIGQNKNLSVHLCQALNPLRQNESIKCG